MILFKQSLMHVKSQGTNPDMNVPVLAENNP
jgi:hypothetical protein